ncbi:hypothetical protein AN477_12590 [Alicyclobacillus ferrooxydans]|uniref:DUF4149 domain-containing protein n=1 Tax=Alicyclobacillus ferrooxydans TaxID=471514 RepID=A0A0P9CKA4_9BACL|nr:hypothetical protein AN477_12590 [Alicyclobacillus ferrooxydans]
MIRKLTWWVVLLPIVMFIAMAIHSVFWLNFAHVLAGVLWTGADIFMGFMVGPILRKLLPDQRKAFINWLVPKTMIYLPVLAFTTGTAGWTMASWLRMMVPGNPERPWIIGALVVITILAVTGFGFLLPTSIRTYLELQKPTPSLEKVFRLNRRNNSFAGIQGLFQVIIIFIMAHLVMG